MKQKICLRCPDAFGEPQSFVHVSQHNETVARARCQWVWQ